VIRTADSTDSPLVPDSWTTPAVVVILVLIALAIHILG